MKALIAGLCASVVLAGTVILVAAPAHASTPVCQIELISENSGAGPNYPIKVCNSGGPVFTKLPAGQRWVLVVDGGPLPEQNKRIATIVLAEVKG